MYGIFLFLGQAIVYFAVMAALFRARALLGLGVFVCALGVLHFLETYLASVLIVQLPFGLSSPGSAALFSGKLAVILLLYIREDAQTVRQPIYGLLVGNMLMVVLGLMLRVYTAAQPVSGGTIDLGFIDEIGALMVWGTALLFIDSIAAIMLYERLRAVKFGDVVLRIFATLAMVLSFDQVFFYLGLRFVADVPPIALLGGWAVKMGSALLYSVLVGFYLQQIESRPLGRKQQNLGDVFDKLTYRHRYEELLGKSGIDALTGALDRGQFDSLGPSSVRSAVAGQRPVSLAIIDIDHFKAINDRYGHVKGDEVLRRVAATLKNAVRSQDKVFRYGGEEFIVLCDGLPHDAALAHADRLRRAIPSAVGGEFDLAPTVSIGVATCPKNGVDIVDLLRHADAHLYEAKRLGRDRVIGDAL